MQTEQQSEQLLGLLAQRLDLGTSEQDTARTLFRQCWQILEADTRSSVSLLQGERNEEVWRGCIVWLLKSIPGLIRRSAPADSKEPPAGLPLSEILNACHINLISFFKELPIVLNKVKPQLLEATNSTEDFEAVLKLREWQETLVSLQNIANKYKDLFWNVQRSSSTPKQPLLRAGWLTFLLLKAQLLPGFPDLVSCMELLVCVMNLFVASSTLFPEQLHELQSSSPAAIDANSKFNTLKALAQQARLDYGKAKELMPQIEARFRALLESCAFSWVPTPLPDNIPHSQAAVLETCCVLHLQGLVDTPQHLTDLVLSLDQAYQTYYMQQVTCTTAHTSSILHNNWHGSMCAALIRSMLAV
eukprot:GHRR01027061.1.p1 GENE.GHRR01027061.1~~GHRR01027061.1.p1  ORF type:complete len:359 (+),score=85.18 GHRR01027061.1:944-2020(+)